MPRHPKHHSCTLPLAAAASDRANKRGWLTEECIHCDQHGVFRQEDSNSAGGYAVEEPCPHCAGYGWFFSEYEDGPVATVPEVAALPLEPA